MHAHICSDKLTHARICSYMLACDHVCSYLLIFAHIRSSMLIDARICSYMLIHARILLLPHIYNICSYMLLHAHARLHMNALPVPTLRQVKGGGGPEEEGQSDRSPAGGWRIYTLSFGFEAR